MNPENFDQPTFAEIVQGYEDEIAVLHARERVRNAEVARLTSELAAAREDAERYLWLKDNAYLWPTMPCTSVDQFERCALWLDHERVDIDAEIDAARRAGGEG